jgi:hypothetical protein
MDLIEYISDIDIAIFVNESGKSDASPTREQVIQSEILVIDIIKM